MAKSDRFIVLSFEDREDETPRGAREEAYRPRGFPTGPTDVTRGVGTARAAGSAAPKAKVKLEVKRLAAKDREEIESNPKRFAARPMPVRLIKPLDRGRAKVANAPKVGWGIQAVGAESTDENAGSDVVVAVLDTGIAKDYKTHPAFKGVNIIAKNFTSDVGHDIDGHGTHCAGTIFGRDVKGTRIGIARGVKKALIGKVIGEDGGSTEAIVEAIQWAYDNGAHVVSMSLGIDFPGLVEELKADGIPSPRATSDALAAFRDTVRLFDKLSEFLNARGSFAGHGVLVVAAAGNESARPQYTIDCSPPANADGILPVAAVDSKLKVAPFSNTGARVAAPGVDIVSAAPNGGLESMSGTSMATPHVAGVAALWAQQLIAANQFDSAGLMNRLVGNTKLIKGADFVAVGNGLVQAP